MAAPQRRRIDVMLEPAYLDGIEQKSIDDVRAMHDACLEVETEVSYVRRLAQARIDLVERLPEILADPAPRTDPVESRLPRHLAPSPDITWRRGLEVLIADATLANLPTLPDDELRATLDQLRRLEREVSDGRVALHEVIDQLQAALGARHKLERA
jgi:hypothetical protein